MKTLHTNSSYLKKHATFFIFMMLLFLMLYGKTNAQEQMSTQKTSSYFRFGLGYGLPSGSQLMETNSTYTYSQTSSTSKTEGVYGSLGAGLVFNSSYVHMYSRNIGLDLNLQYLWGKKYEGVNTTTDTYAGITNSYKSTVYSRGWLFGPSMVAIIGEGKVKPYVQVGIVMGKLKVLREMTSSPAFNSSTEYHGGISFGFKGGFGIEAPLSEHAIFFTELIFTSMSYYPKESQTTSSANGLNERVEYVKELTTNYNGNPSNSNSHQELRDSAPFGNVCVSAGLKLKLKKKV